MLATAHATEWFDLHVDIAVEEPVMLAIEFLVAVRAVPGVILVFANVGAELRGNEEFFRAVRTGVFADFSSLFDEELATLFVTRALDVITESVVVSGG